MYCDINLVVKLRFIFLITDEGTVYRFGRKYCIKLMMYYRTRVWIICLLIKIIAFVHIEVVKLLYISLTWDFNFIINRKMMYRPSVGCHILHKINNKNEIPWKDIYKHTYRSPNGKTKNQINRVIIK